MTVEDAIKVYWEHHNYDLIPMSEWIKSGDRPISHSICHVEDITTGEKSRAFHKFPTGTPFNRKVGVTNSFKKLMDKEKFEDKELRKKLWTIFFSYTKPEKEKYYYKGNPYERLIASEIKITGIIRYFRSIGLNVPEHIEQQMLANGKWMPVEIYMTKYKNPDGVIWVREQGEFKELFKKENNENTVTTDSTQQE